MVFTTLDDDGIRLVRNDIYDVAFDFLMDYGVDISVVISNQDTFNEWLGVVPFYKNVNDEGVVLGE